MVRHVISWCAMTCATAIPRPAPFSIRQYYPPPPGYGPPRVPSGNAGATPRSREGAAGGAIFGAIGGNAGRGAAISAGVGAIGGAIRRGTARSSGYCYDIACKVGDRPREEARVNPRLIHARAVGALARCLRAAAPAFPPNAAPKSLLHPAAPLAASAGVVPRRYLAWQPAAAPTITWRRGIILRILKRCGRRIAVSTSHRAPGNHVSNQFQLRTAPLGLDNVTRQRVNECPCACSRAEVAASPILPEGVGGRPRRKVRSSSARAASDTRRLQSVAAKVKARSASSGEPNQAMVSRPAAGGRDNLDNPSIDRAPGAI